MIRLRNAATAALIAATCILLLPATAGAQSAFTGTVKDSSGAVLPGVTVEAASDALIEKTRSVVTDGSGGYRLVDLRPGTYSLTFSLAGFSTVKRDTIQLESNFTMTINTDLRVGALEETLTVTGAAPIVDVQSTTKSQVLNREALDAIPTGRTIQGMGQLITGVSLNSPDVGGSRAMQQTYMSAHGAGASQTTVQVDGLHVNGLDVDGAVQNYFNSSMSQEMVYTTSGASADVAGGGVRLNQIPRDGGNVLSGSLFLGYQQESFAGDNVTQNLIDRGLRASDGIQKLYNIEGALGGPIKKDRVWYFVSARNFVLNTLPSDSFEGLPGTATANHRSTISDTRGVDPQSIRSVQVRIVWQMSQKNKLAAYNDRILKNRGSAMTAALDPTTASSVWTSPIYTVGTVKFTSAISSRLLFEGGFSTNYERYNVVNQPGITKERGTPAWYTDINRQDQSLNTQWGASTVESGMAPDRFALLASVSYVTGAHNVKVGVQERSLRPADRSEALLGAARSLTETTLHTVRDLSRLLHPAVLDDIGLSAAVDSYVREFRKRYDLPVEFTHAFTDRLPQEAEAAAYRIVQEALTNIARHARATSCRIILSQVGDSIEVVIADDGVGFDPEAQRSGRSDRGLGLLGMHERVARLDGRCVVDSAPGRGTSVTVTLPLQRSVRGPHSRPLAGSVLGIAANG